MRRYGTGEKAPEKVRFVMQKGQNTVLVSKNGLLAHADQLRLCQNHEDSETEDTEGVK